MTDASMREDRLPLTWVDAFPWLPGVDGAHLPSSWCSEAIDASDRDLRLAQIAELAMEHLSQWGLGQIFPGLPPGVALVDLGLPTRALNAFGRRRYYRAGDIEVLTVAEIMEWKGVGVGTLDAVLRTLADASTSIATPSVVVPRPAPDRAGSAFDPSTTDRAPGPLPSGPTGASSSFVPSASSPTAPGAPAVWRDAGPPGTGGLPLWLSRAADDLGRLAAWNAVVGLTDRPLLGGTPAPGTPPGPAAARERLASLTAADVTDPADPPADAARLLDQAFALLDPRAIRILRSRLLAEQPATLEQLGTEFGITRERVRQVEGKARGTLLGFLMAEGSLPAALAAAARDFVGTIRPLSDLLEHMPALGRTVQAVGRPAWFVLDALDDAYEIEDGWCLAPTGQAARALTLTHLQERADAHGVVRLEEVDVVRCSRPEDRDRVTRQWLAHCGYVVVGDHAFLRTRSVGDHAAAVLSVAACPLTSQEILDRLTVERTLGALKNALSADERFERVDRDTWALTEWGLEVYTGVRSLIREMLARGGGRADIEELIEQITGRYTVSATSVMAYACSPPFETRRGVVRLADRSREVRKTPEGTRRMYRRPGAWLYRVRVSRDHLRGSGSPAPMAVAGLLELSYGQTRLLGSPMGPQVVSWTAPQPTFGSVRRFLMELDVASSSEVFFVIGDDGTFDLEPVDEPTGEALRDALALVGARTADGAAPDALAAAVGLPVGSPVGQILAAYRDRGDDDVADLLAAARTDLEDGVPGTDTPARGVAAIEHGDEPTEREVERAVRGADPTAPGVEATAPGADPTALGVDPAESEDLLTPARGLALRRPG